MWRLATPEVTRLLTKYALGGPRDELEVRFHDIYKDADRMATSAPSVSRERYDALIDRMDKFPLVRENLVVDDYFGAVRRRVAGGGTHYIAKKRVGAVRVSELGLEIVHATEEDVASPNGRSEDVAPLADARRSKLSRSYYILDGSFRLDISSIETWVSRKGSLQRGRISYEVELEATRGAPINNEKLRSGIEVAFSLIYGTDMYFVSDELKEVAKGLNSLLGGKGNIPFDRSVIYRPRELREEDLAIGGVTPNPFAAVPALSSSAYTEKKNRLPTIGGTSALVTLNETLPLSHVVPDSGQRELGPLEMGGKELPLRKGEDKYREYLGRLEKLGAPNMPSRRGRWFMAGALRYGIAALPEGEKKLLAFLGGKLWLVGEEANLIMDSRSIDLSKWNGTVLEGLEIRKHERRPEMGATPSAHWFFITDVLAMHNVNIMGLGFRDRLRNATLFISDLDLMQLQPMIELNVVNHRPVTSPDEFFRIMSEHMMREPFLPFKLQSYSIRPDEVPYYMARRKVDRVDRQKTRERILTNLPDHCVWHPPGHGKVDLELRFGSSGMITSALSSGTAPVDFSSILSISAPKIRTFAKAGGIYELVQQGSAGWKPTALRRSKAPNKAAFVQRLLHGRIGRSEIKALDFGLLRRHLLRKRAETYVSQPEAPTAVLGASSEDAQFWIGRSIIVLEKDPLALEKLRSAYKKVSDEISSGSRWTGDIGPHRMLYFSSGITSVEFRLGDWRDLGELGRKVSHIVANFVFSDLGILKTPEFFSLVGRVMSKTGTLSMLDYDAYVVNELFDPHFANGYPIKKFDIITGRRIVSLELRKSASSVSKILDLKGLRSADPIFWTVGEGERSARAKLVPFDAIRGEASLLGLEVRKRESVRCRFLPSGQEMVTQMITHVLMTPLGVPVQPTESLSRFFESDKKFPPALGLAEYRSTCFSGSLSARGTWMTLTRLGTTSGTIEEALTSLAGLARLNGRLVGLNLRKELASRGVGTLVIKETSAGPLLVSVRHPSERSRDPLYIFFLKNGERHEMIGLCDNDVAVLVFGPNDPLSVALTSLSR